MAPKASSMPGLRIGRWLRGRMRSAWGYSAAECLSPVSPGPLFRERAVEAPMLHFAAVQNWNRGLCVAGATSCGGSIVQRCTAHWHHELAQGLVHVYHLCFPVTNGPTRLTSWSFATGCLERAGAGAVVASIPRGAFKTKTPRRLRAAFSTWPRSGWPRGL